MPHRRHIMHDLDCLNPTEHAAPYSLIGGTRPPNWRWREASWVLRHGGDCHYIRDRLVWRTVYYQRACAATSSEDDLFTAFPGMYRVHHLWRSVGDLQRCYLEALLLTSEPLEKVAQIMMHAPKDVDLYERIFFNVRPYLNNKFYIYATVFKDMLAGGLSPDQTGLLLAYAAYHGGVEAMEDLMGLDRVDDESAQDHRSNTADHFRDIRYWQAVHMVEMNNYNQIKLINSHDQKKIGEEDKAVDNEAPSVRGAVNDLIKGVKISVHTVEDALTTADADDRAKMDTAQSRLKGAQRKSELKAKTDDE